MQRPELLPSGRWRGVARDRHTGRRHSATRDDDGNPFLHEYQAAAWAKVKEAEIDAAYGAVGPERWRPTGPHQRVNEITKQMVTAFLTSLADRGLVAGTEEAYLARLRAAVVEAVELGLRPDDPTHGVTARRAARPVHRIYRQLGGVRPGAGAPALVAARGGDLVVRHGATGREVAGLRWFRVDLLNRRLVVADVALSDRTLRPSPKGKRTRVLP